MRWTRRSYRKFRCRTVTVLSSSGATNNPSPIWLRQPGRGTLRVITQGCRGRFRRATTSCATGPEDPQDWIALDWLPWGTFAVDRSLRERTAQPRLGRGTKYDPGVSIRRGKG